MTISKKNLKDDLSVCCEKTNDFIVACGKWVGAFGSTSWHLMRGYYKLKMHEHKVKDECLRLGKSAYSQWKNEQEISLVDKLQRLRAMEIQITDTRKNLKRSAVKMATLFGGRRRKKPSIVVQKNNIKPEKKSGKETVSAKDQPKETKKSATKSRTSTTRKKSTTRKSGSTATKSTKTGATPGRKSSTKKSSAKNGTEKTESKQPVTPTPAEPKTENKES